MGDYIWSRWILMDIFVLLALLCILLYHLSHIYTRKHSHYILYCRYICYKSWLIYSSISGIQCRYINLHSSQFQGLRSTKNSSETLQNLPYFWNTKTNIVFFRTRVFVFQKYGKFWNILPEFFIKHKPFNCEECLYF